MSDSSIRTGPGRPGQVRRIRRLTASAGLCAAVALVAGCGSAASSTPGSAAKPLTPRQAISLASTASQRVNSATTTISIKIGSAGTMSGQMQMQIKPSLLVNASMKVAISGKTIPFSEVVTTKAIYLKVPGLFPEGGRPWVKIAFSQLSGKAGATFGQLLQGVQNGNPMNQTALLSGSKDVRATGAQRIDGVQTTRYTGTYTPSAAISRLPPALRQLMRPQLKQLQGNVKFTIWIDGQHQTRQIVENETLAGQALVVTMNITAINQPVSITVPPASQVASLPKSLTGPADGKV
jgi:hypothetical protein